MEITHMDWPRAVLHMGVSEVEAWGEIATALASSPPDP